MSFFSSLLPLVLVAFVNVWAQDPGIKGIRIVVEEKYADSGKALENVTVKKVCDAMLQNVVIAANRIAGRDGDMRSSTLKVTISGNPLEAEYFQSQWRFSGAVISGTVELVAPEFSGEVLRFNGVEKPPQAIGSESYRGPQEAPFGSALVQSDLLDQAVDLISSYSRHPRVELLLGLFGDDRSYEVDSRTIGALGKTGAREAVRPLLVVMAYGWDYYQGSLRSDAFAAIASIGASVAAPELVASMRSDDDAIREQAFVCAGKLNIRYDQPNESGAKGTSNAKGPPKTINPPPDVSGDSTLFSLARKLATSKFGGMQEVDLRKIIAEVRRAGGSKAVDALDWALDSRDHAEGPEVRLMIAELAELGDRRATGHIIRILELYKKERGKYRGGQPFMFSTSRQICRTLKVITGMEFGETEAEKWVLWWKLHLALPSYS